MPIAAGGGYTLSMTRRNALLVLLIAVLAFKAGMAFDRWLHRPIVAGGFHITVPVGEWTHLCFGDDFALKPCDDPPPCYSDKPEECPKGTAGGKVVPNAKFPIKPLTDRCWFAPYPNEACQQET